jgi:hypothetical protein
MQVLLIYIDFRYFIFKLRLILIKIEMRKSLIYII